MVIDKHRVGVHISSAVRVQLCFDVNPTDGTLPAGGQPLVHAALVEEMHAGQSPGGTERDGETRGVNVDVKSTTRYSVQLCAREEPLTPGGVNSDHSDTQTQLLLSHQRCVPVRQLYAVN